MSSMVSIRLRSIPFAALVFALAAVGSLPASAQGTERLGDFSDWSAFRFHEGGNAACYIASEPKKAQGKYKQRGEVYVLVSHWPTESRRNEVSFLSGYNFKKDSIVSVNIDGREIKLFTDADRAYAADKDTDERMVSAMRKGNRMVVRGTSSRGTKTTDTYSLKGFTKALKKIDQICPK